MEVHRGHILVPRVWVGPKGRAERGSGTHECVCQGVEAYDKASRAVHVSAGLTDDWGAVRENDKAADLFERECFLVVHNVLVVGGKNIEGGLQQPP